MKKLALVFTCACVSAFGWGGEGHNLVARIAWEQLTPAVRARVQEILGPGVTMASVSSWADQVRNQRRDTGPWHYIDIPINQPHLNMGRDCPKGDCVLTKIEEFRKALKDPATEATPRREALMFLIHFVGDMHQPLHCSDNKDQGGNGVRVQLMWETNGRPTNLHSLWDSILLNRLPTIDIDASPAHTAQQREDELFADWSADSMRHASKWARGTVFDWAEDSHKESVKVTYGRLPFIPPPPPTPIPTAASSIASQQPPPAAGQSQTQGTQRPFNNQPPVPVDLKYEKKADPVVKKQIEKAGARLARVLNEALK